MSEKVSIHRRLAVLLLVAAFALSGCSSKPSKPDAGAGEANAANASALEPLRISRLEKPAMTLTSQADFFVFLPAQRSQL